MPELDADADTDPIANLFDSADVHDDVRLNMDMDGDEPPYNHNIMTGATSVEETVSKAIVRTRSRWSRFSACPRLLCSPRPSPSQRV